MKVDENLSKDELQRYARQVVLPDFGPEGQLALKNAKILVVGAGGLGCPVLLYLTAAGIGEIGIVDEDAVSITNLQRQILYTTEDVGKKKAKVASQRLTSLNPYVSFNIYDERLTAQNAPAIVPLYDLVVDCTDNFPARYLINDACVLSGIPFIYGSVYQMEGQLAVLNHKEGPTYRDLFPTPPAPDAVPSCEQGGILGVLPAIIGSMQALEAIKIITRKEDNRTGRLHLWDALTLETTSIEIPQKNQRHHVKGLIDYDEFCNTKTIYPTAMKEVTVSELKALKDKKADFQLIDVREPHEYDTCNLEGELIPQAEIPHNVEKISKDKQVIVHCRSGARSGNMIMWLEKNHGFTNLYNLKGGILAWAKEIDPSMPTY